MRKKITLINFSGRRKNYLKMALFWPPLHNKIKLNFPALAVDMQNFYEFAILNSSYLQ